MHSRIKTIIYQALKIKQPDSSALEAESSLVSQGMGRWNRYLSIMENQADAIEQLESIEQDSGPIKLILADGLYFPPSSIFDKFIQAFFEIGEVYPWKGEMAFLTTPYPSPDSFNKKRQEIKPASVKQVNSALPRQGRAADEFKVIDYTTMVSMLQEFSKDPSISKELIESLDLSASGKKQLNLKTQPISDKKSLEMILAIYEAQPLESIKINAPTIDEILLVKKYFPNVEIEIANATQEWLDEYSHYETSTGKKLFAGQSLVFINCHPTFHAKLSCKNLKIHNASKLESISFESRDAELESFTLSQLDPKKFEFSAQHSILKNVDKLQVFDISQIYTPASSNIININDVILPALDTLHTLRFPFFNGKDFDFSRYPNLVEIKGKSLDGFYFPPVQPPKLKHLDNGIDYEVTEDGLGVTEYVIGSTLKKELTANNYPNLKKLSIRIAAPELLNSVNTLTKLTKLEITTILEKLEKLILPKTLTEFSIGNSLDIEEIDFSLCSGLKTLSLTRFSGKHNLHVCTELETLKVSKSQKIIADLEQFKKLKNLTFEVIPYSTIKKWNIKKCRGLNSVTFSDVELGDDINIEIGDVEFFKMIGPLISKSKEIKFENAEFKNFILENRKQLENLSINNANLESLSIRDCDSLNSLNLSECTKLRSIRLQKCGFTSFPPLPLRIDSLEELIIEDCGQLNTINFASFPNLKRLIIKNSPIQSLEGLSALTNLEELIVEKISPDLNIEQLDLSRLPKLKLLTISHFTKLLNINLPDKTVSELEKFECSDCPKTELNIIAPKLKELKVQNAKTLQIVSPCHNLYKLGVKETKLRMDGGSLPQLKIFNLMTSQEPKILHLDKCLQLRAAYLETRDNISIIKNFPKQTIAITAVPLHVEQEDEKKSTLSFQSQTDEKAMEIARLRRHNVNSSVSCLSLSDDEISVDANTAAVSVVDRKGSPLKVSIFKKGDVDKHMYRWRVFDKVKSDARDISFYSSNDSVQVSSESRPTFDENKQQELENLVRFSDKFALGYFSGEMIAGKRYPVTTDCAMEGEGDGKDIELYCNPKTKMTLRYDKAKQQYFMELADVPSGQRCKVSMVYKFKTNPDYLQIPSNYTHQCVYDEAVKNEIPAYIQRKIKQAIAFEVKENGTHPLDFFVKPENLSLEKKMEIIRTYCERFELKKVVYSKAQPTKLDIFIANLMNQAGFCRHRSEVYLVLSRMCGVPARMIRSEGHRFCETPYVSLANGKAEWRGVDLGGGDQVDLTDEEERKLNLEFLPSETKLLSPVLLSARSQQNRFAKLVEEIEQEKLIENIFSSLTERSEIKTHADLFKEPKSLLTPLIYIPEGHTSYEVNKIIIQQQKKTPGKDYLYIDSASDFELFLKPCQIKDGKRIRLDGPLLDIINNAGTILVNWSHFTTKQIMIYKSILDKIGTLHGHEFSPNTRIINITTRKQENYPAFTSRCQPFIFNDEFFNALEVKDKKEEKKREEKTLHSNSVVIHLFNQTMWQEKVYGTVSPGKPIKLVPGPLINAILENKPVIIYDAPNRRDFQTLIHRIKDEGVVLYNGEYIKVPPNFSITLLESKPIPKPANVYFIDEIKESPPKKRKLIRLCVNDLHRLYEDVVPDKKRDSEVKPGLLDTFDPETQLLYFTESIPPKIWDALMLHIASNKKYDATKFIFKPGPGVKIKDIAKGPDITPPEKVKYNEILRHHPVVITTNDTDFMCSQIEHQLGEEKTKPKLKPRIVHVSANDSFGNLIAGRTPVLDEKDPDKIEFQFKQSPYLADLIAGRTVIFTGNISASLYKQLLPLLSDPPEFEFGGEPLKIKGKLILIIPNSVSKKIKPDGAKACDFELKDYLEAFPDPNDKDLIIKIDQMITQAQLLPETGIGIPKRPVLSFELIKTMLHVLRQEGFRFHPHNPIKPALIYKYPKGSNHYAYLNVMGKMIFRPDDEVPARLNKLNRLLTKYVTDQEIQDNLWQFLNCFNGKFLKSILPGNFSNFIDVKTGFPQLTPELIPILIEKIKTLAMAPEDKVAYQMKRTHTEKREHELRACLEDKNCQMITLIGFSGVGKTETIRRLKTSYKIYEIDKKLLDPKDMLIRCLKDKTPGKKIVFIDEANMSQSGSLDYLKEIRRGFDNGRLKEIEIDNVKYPVDQNIKFVFTGNPVSYTRRYQHDIMDVYSRTIYFKLPTDAELISMVNEALSFRLANSHHKILLTAFHLACKHNPLYTYSIRDLINAAQRLRLSSSFITTESVVSACLNEFSTTFYTPEQRKQFVDAFSRKYKMPHEEKVKMFPIVISPDEKTNYYFPGTKFHVIKAIQQDLEMRDLDIERPLGYTKKIVLLEGNYGLGKSTLFESILRQKGFSKEADAKTYKKYYLVSQDNKGEAKKIIVKAAKEGAIVILDEMNVNAAEVEEIINLVEKLEKNGKIKRGFRIFATQNSSKDEGISATTASMLNRCHVIQMHDNTKEDLVTIAKYNRIPNPYYFVDAYLKREQLHPEITNMRTFNAAMERYQQVLEAKNVVSRLRLPQTATPQRIPTPRRLTPLRSVDN